MNHTFDTQIQRQPRFGLCLLAVVVSMAVVAKAEAAPIEHLASEIANLRGAVEQMHRQLTDAEAAHKNSISSLAMRKADLDTAISRDKLRLQRLIVKYESKLSEQELFASGADSLAKVMTAGLDQLETLMIHGLPFRLSERLSMIQEMRKKISDPVTHKARLLAEFWAIFEDEMRLRRESTIHRQVIPLDGEQQLVEVARLGMMAMFFKTPEDQYGKFVRSEAGYKAVRLSDSKEIAATRVLFDSIRKNIRTGKFTIPNTLDMKEQQG